MSLSLRLFAELCLPAPGGSIFTAGISIFDAISELGRAWELLDGSRGFRFAGYGFYASFVDEEEAKILWAPSLD